MRQPKCRPAFFLILLLVLLAPALAQAQTESDEKPLINVSKGLSFAKDSLFLLNLRFRMQNRVGVRTNSLDDWTVNDIEARVRRLRLRFDGFVGSPKLQYYIQLSFSRADQDQEGEGEDDAKIIRDAVVSYHFNDDFYIALGQAKLPGNRQRMVSSGSLQFADRSIANRAFTVDRDFGLFAYYTLRPGRGVLRLKGALSTGEGRNITRTDNGLAYTIRAEWMPLGDFRNTGQYSEGDLEFEPRPRLALAAGVSENRRTLQTGGQLGDPLLAPIDLTTWMADGIAKWQGYALQMEWLYRSSSLPEAQGLGGEILPIGQGRAFNVQFSKVTRRYWEGVFRYARLSPRHAERLPQQEEWLLGVNRYFNKHRIKCQFNIGYYNSQLTGAPRREWMGAMFQVEFGI